MLCAAALLLDCQPATPKRGITPEAGHHAEIRGIRVYYEIHGQGPPLILLHGGAGNGQQFSAQVPFFAQHHRVIVPDACGQGRSAGRAGRSRSMTWPRTWWR